MFDEIADLIIKRLQKNNLYKKLLLVLGLVAILVVFWVQYYSKGSLSVILKGYDSSSSIVELTKIASDKSSQDKERTIEKQGREVSFKLSPGKYRIKSIVRSSNNIQEASTSKYVEIKARSSLRAELNLYDNRPEYIKDTIDKVSSLQIKNDKIYVTTVYGVTTVYSLNGESSSTIRKEPIFLNKVVGLCVFSNGNAVALNSVSKFFAISGNQATELDVASLASADQLQYLEGSNQTNANGTRRFNCDDQKVIINGGIEIDSSFSIIFKNIDDSSNIKRSNYIRTNDGRLFSFDRVDSNSFDFESPNSEVSLSKSITYVKDHEIYEANLDSYISDVAPLSGTEFCYSYQYSIKCGDVKTGKANEIFKSEENIEISNIEAVDAERIVYSYGKYVMLYNVKTDESSELYSSDGTVIPYTLTYDSSTKTLIFATQRVEGENSSYSMPVLRLDQV